MTTIPIIHYDISKTAQDVANFQLWDTLIRNNDIPEKLCPALPSPEQYSKWVFI
jgi:hypothetical protein